MESIEVLNSIYTRWCGGVFVVTPISRYIYSYTLEYQTEPCPHTSAHRINPNKCLVAAAAVGIGIGSSRQRRRCSHANVGISTNIIAFCQGAAVPYRSSRTRKSQAATMRIVEPHRRRTTTTSSTTTTTTTRSHIM